MTCRKTILLICISIFLLSERKANAQADTFHYVSDTIQTWIVPPCVNQVTIQMWGAGGGSGYMASYNDSWCAGSGAYMEGVLSGLSYGDILTLYVPHGGAYYQPSVYSPGGWPGGGRAGADFIFHEYGGGGGGYAAVAITGTYFGVAGAGGGGGSTEYGGTAYAGGGGATSGGNGVTTLGTAGSGGTISVGGNGGSAYNIIGQAGTYLTGGDGEPNFYNGDYGGGGGGGGYYGGGGGGDEGNSGGGGSSFPASSFSSGGQTFTVLSNLQGGMNSFFSGTAVAPGSPPPGIGSAPIDSAGCNGLIIISYTGGYGIIKISSSIVSTPTCGLCDGTISVSASGGGTPYTYLWSPTGQTSDTATGLCAGTYTVLLSDSCSDTISKVIDLISIPITVHDSVISNDRCYGECAGSAGCSVILGTSPYTYTWSPVGETTATATGLCAGNYTVTVKDKNGCTGTASVTITQPTKITPAVIVTNAICNGGTGSAAASVTGGYSPYTYLWTGGQTNANATGLLIGTYTLTITDNNGCTVTTAATITQPVAITATVSVSSPILCNGSGGSATVSVTGGISPYTYLWTGGQTNANATGLLAGSYTVNVADHNGCTASATVTLTQPTLLTATLGNINNVACYGGIGSATVNAAGGTSPYTYLWTGGQTNATAIGLSAGSYTVTITDKNNCTATATATITQPAAVLAATVSVSSNIGCYNGNNGSATVAASGGTSPYTYLWTPSAITSATANNLFAVSYTITITDAHSCTTIANVTLTQPTQISATISEPKLICKDSTGNLVTNATGGTSPYAYHWSTGATGNIATVTPINTNNYSVTVTDANDCTTTAQIILQYGPAFAVDVKGKNSICAGDSTTLCATAIGALDGVSYLWEPANSTNSCIIVEPSLSSIYTITVVDGCGSTTSATTEVYTVPSPDIKISANINQGCYPLCVQFRNATTISQGSIGQYVWTFGNGDTSHAQNPIYCYTLGGQYNITLTAISDSGCSATFSNIGMISVYNHPKAAFTYSPQPTTIENATIQFTDQSTDDYGLIYWSWTFGQGTSTISHDENPVYKYQDTGQYCPQLIVMNKKGCTDTTTNCLIIEPAYKLYVPSAFTPNADGLNETFQPKGIYIRTFDMYIFDRWGQPMFHSSNINQGWNGEVNGSGAICQEDTYIYKISVTDAQGILHNYIGNVTLLK